MSKFDQIRKSIKTKKRKIHFIYVFIVIILIISGYFVGVKFEERKRTELHKLGLIYVRDTDDLKQKIKLLEIKNIYIDSIPFGYPLTKNVKINSNFGWRKTPLDSNGGRSFHYGIDYKGKYKSPCIATSHGRILQAGYKSSLGNYVIIQHSLSYKTTYAHLSKLNVELYQNVKKGDTIGFVGSTGRSTGPHLHYEIQVNGEKVDPLDYINYIKK